ncbi:hypothetical protein WN943_010684 [Citrus x changshan-huyou]
MSHIQLKELQEGNHTKLSLLDLGIDDVWVVKMPPPMRAHIWSRPQSPHDEGNVRADAKGRSTQKLAQSVEHKSNLISSKKGGMVNVHRPTANWTRATRSVCDELGNSVKGM